MKKSRIILLAGIGIVIIAVGIGLSMYYKPHKTFVGAEPDFEFTAAELVNSFTRDEAAATAEYVADDKVLLVTGEVRDITTGDGGAVIVVLGSADMEGSVSCTLTAEESKRSGIIKIGEAVRITGQCTGMQGLIEPEVIMIRCGFATD